MTPSVPLQINVRQPVAVADDGFIAVLPLRRRRKTPHPVSTGRGCLQSPFFSKYSGYSASFIQLLAQVVQTYPARE
jgi:transposase